MVIFVQSDVDVDFAFAASAKLSYSVNCKVGIHRECFLSNKDHSVSEL